MMDLIEILLKGFACGVAALGFGILFNAPRRSLWMLSLVGLVGGIFKFGLMLPEIGARIVLATFMASLAIGFMGVFLGNWRKMIPMMITIPSVIPLVPGAFAYKAMLGLMSLNEFPAGSYSDAVNQTVYHGVMTLFVLLSISIGVTIPLVLFKLEFVGKARVGSVSKK